MKLIICELRKLFSVRATAVFLIILLAANFALTLYTARPMPAEKGAREVYSLYQKDPEALDLYREQLEADFYEHLCEEDFELPSTYIDGADDMVVLNKVFTRAEYIRDFRSETLKIADSADRRARELGYFGYSDGSFFILEQRGLERVYTELADTLEGENGYAYGYDLYFENTPVCLFILIYLLFAVSFIFRNDRVCGFGGIMMATKRGRIGSAWAKIAAAVIVSITSTLLFLGATFIAVGMANGGFSSITAPVQLLPSYSRVPFKVSMLGYLCIQTGYRLLAAVIFTLFTALVASVGTGYVFCFGIGGLFSAANYFIFAREYRGTTPPIRYLNIASAAEGVELLAFHRELDLFGFPIPYTAALIAICVLCIAALSTLCAIIYCKNIHLVLPKRTFLGKIGLKISKNGSRSELRVRPLLPLWVYELGKNRFLPLALVALLLLAARCTFVSSAVGSGALYGEAIYYGYIADIKELPAEERRAYLAQERAELESMILGYEPMTAALESGKVTEEEYSAFLQDYYRTKDRERVFGDVEEYSEYIDRKSESLGIECDVIYNTGYERFFSMGTDWFLFAAIVILSVGIFAVEYQSGNCAQIIRTAKKGRRETFISKLLPYLILGAFMGAAFRTSGLIVTAKNYELSDIDATLCSIRAFEAVADDISILRYLVTDILCSALAGGLTACAVCLISCIFKKTLHSLGAVGLTLALPALLSGTGFAIINLYAPNRAYCASFARGARMQAVGFAGIILYHVLATALLGHIAARAFVGKGSFGKKEKDHGQ